MQPATATFILTLIPPSLALLVECLNPINERSLKASAENNLRDYEQGINHQHLIDATKFANSAVEVAGLAPTFIATIATGFGISREFPDPLWPAVIFVLIFIILGLFLWFLLSGQTYIQMDDTRQPVPFFGGSRTLPYGTTIISIFIYAANVILILFIVIAYKYAHTPTAHP
jgi:hypothetical protein